MRGKILLLSSVAILALYGCSSKEYYTPQTIHPKTAVGSTADIVYFSRDGATLSSGLTLTSTDQFNLKLNDGYRFINRVENKVVVADKRGGCKVIIDGKEQKVNFPKALVAGTIIGDALVYLLQDNNFGIYNLSTKSIVYNNKGEKVYSIDTRIANPLQVDNLVVIPLLDGKLVVLDLRTLKVSKEIYVSTESSLNNIIFLKRFKKSLIAATPHKVISVSNQGKKEFDREVSEVLIDDDSVFVFSKDGRVSKLDESMVVQAEKKFKFAHFSTSALYKDKIYALDKQGYLIVSNKNFTKDSTYEFSEVEGYSFVSGKYLYYDKNRIDLTTLSY